MKKRFVLLAALAAMSAGAALAQQHDYISELDTDHDGLISRAEFSAMQSDHFNRQDHNGDGQLSAEEAHLGVPLSREAYASQALGVFDSADANHDGSLAGDEVTALRTIVTSGRTAAPPSDAESAMQAILEPDVCYVGNHDGAVSRAEFEATAANHFGRQDTNGDGEINGDEHGRPGGPRTRDAYVADAVTVFDSMDTNHDGVQSGEELTRMRDLALPTIRAARASGWLSGCH